MSAVTTGVIRTLTVLASKPLHAVSNITLYVETPYQIADASAFSVLETESLGAL